MNIPSKRVRDAVNSLILSNPLFAGILLQQRFIEDNGPDNPTFSVDGETFAYNAAFADSLSFDECKAVCAHEALHIALLHHCRLGSRDFKQWNSATDYAINSELTKQGFRLPSGALLDARFAGKSAEDIYRTLASEQPNPQPKQAPQPSPQGQTGSQPAQGQPGPGNGQPDPNGAPSMGQVKPGPAGSNPKVAEAKAKAQVEKAMTIARMAGSLSGEMERTVKSAGQPRMDWREVLHRFFQEFTARDYSFASPNRRFIQSGFVLPSLRSRDLGKIVLAIDTSGSVSEAEVSAMVGEMQACLQAYCEAGLSAGLTVIYCDSTVQGVETLFDGDVAHPKGGGGTRFVPVFEHLEREGLDGAACLVYLTDGENGSRDAANLAAMASPAFPVLWGLIQDNAGFAPPFGETFRLDVHA